ncbi:MAG: DUF1800 family protein [Burkholderiales bacterium]
MLRLMLSILPFVAAATALAAPMGADEARYLLTRAGFAATEAEVRQYAPLARAEAVERLLSGARREARTPPPTWVHEPAQRPRLNEKSDQERREFLQLQVTRGFELRSWWMAEMLATPSPLTERMTLFWHNHFVSSLQKVRVPQLMYRQNLLLRRHALGDFGELLRAVSKDAAMIIYLDVATSRRGAPNENFAREVMELFTLGEGNYSERDIKEAARAFTGWSLDPDNLEFRRRPMLHDDGVKTVFGRSGEFDGDAVLDLLLAQPACAEFIMRKLWREFVSMEPSAADAPEIKRIAALFRSARYDIRTALRAMFNSPRFYAPEQRGGLIKSPVELVVGTVRQLGVSYTDPLPWVFTVGALGQTLLAPPNVRGWPGGESWINSSTLLARKQFAERLIRSEEMREGAGRAAQAMGATPASANTDGVESPMRARDIGEVKGAGRMDGEARQRLMRAAAGIQFDSDLFLAQFAGQPQSAMQRALLAVEPAATPAANAAPRQVLRAALLDPAYQLK